MCNSKVESSCVAIQMLATEEFIHVYFHFNWTRPQAILFSRTPAAFVVAA